MEDKKLKFRLKKGKGAVQGFTDATGVTHLPGEIVELPAKYEGENWLERVDLELKPVASPAKVEAPSEPEKVVPFEASAKKSKTAKK